MTVCHDPHGDAQRGDERDDPNERLAAASQEVSQGDEEFECDWSAP